MVALVSDYKGRTVREFWAVYNGDLFDRIVWVGWGIERQHLCMNPNTGALTWRRVPFFGRRK